MTDCLGSFEWRTLQLTTCERILRSSNASADEFNDQNHQNEEIVVAQPTRKRKDDDAVRPTQSFDLQELFATLVEVQTLPSMLMPRYSLLVSDLTSLRHCRVEFWCDLSKTKLFSRQKKKKKKKKKPLTRRAGSTSRVC
jgi:hypothetical protein